ncbi:MAG: transglutaminase domain-containing protein [Oscillospiraceae bacterium]|nr:transglutaminase domain-containing protein [Oscillospiraceae bacterium]
MKRAVMFFVLLALLIPFASLSAPSVLAAEANGSGTASQILKGSKSEIDATNKNDGYVKVRYLNETSKKIKVRINKLDASGREGTEYTYDLSGKGVAETFSFQSGNGKYRIKVLENIEGTKYSVAQTETVDVSLKDEYAPFLIPIQHINYQSTSKAVLKAKELTKDAKTELEKVQLIYRFIVNHIVYDKQKAQLVIDGKLSGYIPSVDTVLADRKGICFDYSSLMGAMLRSLNIPTKLIMGYVAPNNAYHAWNEVYIKGEGWIKINSSIYFDGENWSRMDSTFAAGNKSGKQTEFIGNGKNYSKKYEY